MVRSNSLKSLTVRLGAVAKGSVSVLFVSALFLAFLPSAFGQDFTLTAASFNPVAVDPGGTSISTITVSPLNGFNSAVDLSCTVAPQQTTGTPVCTVSPASVTNSTATATVTTSGTTPPALYTFTITGTGGGLTHSAQQNLTVLAVTPQFTITVGTTIAPSSVHAGSGGQGVVNVNPVNGYSGSVTLSCSAVTPVVPIAPVCSFNPQTVTVNGTLATSTITISTTGPPVRGALSGTRRFYAAWLSFPVLSLMGVGIVAGGKRSRKTLGVLSLLVLVAALLLMPACGSSSSTTTTTTTTGVTPNNTYTFTLQGVDANGVVSSNTGTTSSPTVSLTVN